MKTFDAAGGHGCAAAGSRDGIDASLVHRCDRDDGSDQHAGDIAIPRSRQRGA